jgi:hypothetical protein
MSKYRLRKVYLEDDTIIYNPQVLSFFKWYNLDVNGEISQTAAKCITYEKAKSIIDKHRNFFQNKKIRKISYEDLD